MALKSKGLFSLIMLILKLEFWAKTIAKKVIINKNKRNINCILSVNIEARKPP